MSEPVIGHAHSWLRHNGICLGEVVKIRVVDADHIVIQTDLVHLRELAGALKRVLRCAAYIGTSSGCSPNPGYHKSAVPHSQREVHHGPPFGSARAPAQAYTPVPRPALKTATIQLYVFHTFIPTQHRAVSQHAHSSAHLRAALPVDDAPLHRSTAAVRGGADSRRGRSGW